METNNKLSPKLNQEKPQRNFKGIWIPKEIWLMEGLLASEKALWGEIDSLYDEEKGGCFASNEYLAKFNGVKLRRLQVMLSNLKSKGLIKDVSFNGRERILKAVNPKEVACQTCSIMHGRSAGYCTHITKNIYKETLSKDNAKKNAHASTPKEKLIERAPNIKTTDPEHKKLEDKYGKKIRDWCYEHLSEWKEDTLKSKWKKSDYRTIIRWVSDAYHEDQIKIKKREDFDGEAKNKAMATRIAAKFNGLAKKKGIRIDVNMKALAFVFLTAQKQPIIIRYLENGFKEQVNNLMRKYNLI